VSGDGREAGSFPASITVAELEQDPYPVFARLRAEAPVAWVPAVGMWLATRWEDALAVASEPERFAADMPDSPIDRSFGSPTILTCDGPVHRELRNTVDPRLRPREVETYIDALVEPIVDEHLDRLTGREPQCAELMAELFEPVSVLGLRAVLGIPDVDAETLRRWFAGLAEGATNFEQDNGKQRTSDEVCAEIDARLDPILARLEAAPDETIVSHMLHGGMGAGEVRPRAQFMPSLKVILLGGMQEPGHGAGSVLLALLQHPEQLAEVRSDPGQLLDAAIEEGMRWISPIGTQGRRVVAPTVLGGAELPAGAPIAAVISSANRDERRFERPNDFDLHRPRQRVATFGFGRHFCSGHAFARGLERIALGRLLERLPDFRLDRERPAPPVTGWEFRAPRELHVRWG